MQLCAPKEKTSLRTASAASHAQRCRLYCGTAELLEASGMLVKFRGRSFSIRQVVLMLSLCILGWPKRPFGFFHKILWKNLNDLFGQHNTQIYMFFVTCFAHIN